MTLRKHSIAFCKTNRIISTLSQERSVALPSPPSSLADPLGRLAGSNCFCSQELPTGTQVVFDRSILRAQILTGSEDWHGIMFLDDGRSFESAQSLGKIDHSRQSFLLEYNLNIHVRSTASILGPIRGQLRYYWDWQRSTSRKRWLCSMIPRRERLRMRRESDS